MSESYRDRIKELRRVPAGELKANPKNWRIHPKAQKSALTGILSEVGISDACIAHELPDGTLELIDGHCRTDLLAGETVPVLVLDVTQAEADKLLLSLDPLAAMAGANPDALNSLMASVKVDDGELKAMLDGLSKRGAVAQQGDGQLQDINFDSTEQATFRVNCPWAIRMEIGDALNKIAGQNPAVAVFKMFRQ